MKPLIEAIVKPETLMSHIDLRQGIEMSFKTYKDIYEPAEGCNFDIHELGLS
jgi:hypothetical protein